MRASQQIVVKPKSNQLGHSTVLGRKSACSKSGLMGGFRHPTSSITKQQMCRCQRGKESYLSEHTCQSIVAHIKLLQWNTAPCPRQRPCQKKSFCQPSTLLSIL